MRRWPRTGPWPWWSPRSERESRSRPGRASRWTWSRSREGKGLAPMPTATLLDLRTRARQRANMESSTFVTEAELTRLVNTHHYRLYNRLALAVPYYYSRDFQIVTVPGQIPYALPPDFRSAQVVYAVEQVDHFRPLRNLTDFQRNVYRAPVGA